MQSINSKDSIQARYPKLS